MARRSTTQAAARDRARARAARYLEREQRLVELAAVHEQVLEQLEAKDERLEARVEEIRAQAEQKVQRARQEAASANADATAKVEQIQRAMLDEGVTRREVAERLGIATREVVRASAAKPAGGESSAEPNGEEKSTRW